MIPLAAMARDWCDECGGQHSPERRRAILRRMVPATLAEIVDAWPHFWPDSSRGTASQHRLVRDLHAIGARPRERADGWAV